MKVLVVGGHGMLGTDLCTELQRRGHEVVAPSIDDLDIRHTGSLASVAFNEGGYDWCINCAAYTAVDKAESEAEAAYQVNTLGAGYLAQACAMGNIKFIHISTDFVFDGTASQPYLPEHPTNPLGVYGKSKRDGEESVRNANPTALIVRTAWLYGPNGPSFPRTMMRVHSQGKSLRVVSDQVGCPTYTGDLARVLVDIVEKSPFPGIYHAVGPESMSWHGFATLSLKAYSGSDVEIEAIPTEAYPTPAKRPAYSVLDTTSLYALGVAAMRPVADALSEFVSRLMQSGVEL